MALISKYNQFMERRGGKCFHHYSDSMEMKRHMRTFLLVGAHAPLDFHCNGKLNQQNKMSHRWCTLSSSRIPSTMSLM